MGGSAACLVVVRGLLGRVHILPAMRFRPLALLVAVVALAGCGGSSGGRPLRQATLMLDFTPNAVHAGIYAALARSYDLDAGVRLRVLAPAATTDSVKLLETGRVNFAVLDIHDLAIARERGEDIVGIMAIVERPLASVIAQPGIGSPRALEGRLVGVTGAASDYAVLNSIVSGAGGDPGRLHELTIGFDAVPDLLSGRVAGATAFWNDEGVALAHARPGFHIFQVYDYGAPSYPELVLCATGPTLRRDPALAAAVVGALVRGYRFTIAHPRAAAADLERLVPGLAPKLVSEELAVEEPAFQAGGKVGELDLRQLRAWARWEARFKIVSRAPNVARMFDTRFVARAGA
jgi:ABC-type nitrate/sulfonate/bicarbonate transport system substrate-binding protein